MSGNEKKLIVLADDSASIRRFLEAILKKAGYEVAAAENGLQALDLVRQNSTVAAVVTDHQMPEMTGEELCRAVRSIPDKQSIPLVMLSGLASETGNKPDKTAANAFLTKGEDLKTELLATLERLFTQQTPNEDRSAR